MSDNVGFAGQIGPEHVDQVVEKGFKSIINNRPDMEGGPEQPTSAQIEEAARQAGLDYVYQPVVASKTCSHVLPNRKSFKQSLSISKANGFIRRLNY